MNLKLSDLAYFRSLSVPGDPSFGARLADALEQLQDASNNIGAQTNAMAVGAMAPPPRISAFTVSQANGIFDCQIFDNNPLTRGVEYFIEYSTTPDFARPVVIHVGTTRNYRVNLGNQTFYFRAYSCYATSAPSDPVYFGSQSSPTAVVGAGGVAGPAPHASAGSGTASGDGRDGGAGYGYESRRALRVYV